MKPTRRGKEIARRRVWSKKFDPDRGLVSGHGRRAGCFHDTRPRHAVLVQTDYGRVERAKRDRPMSAIGAGTKELPRQRGGLGRGCYRPSRSDLGGWVRPVPWPPSGARGEKRASHEAGPKGLGHRDTPSIGRKRPLVAASAPGIHPPIAARAQELPEPAPYADPARRVYEAGRRWAVCRSWSPSATEIALPASVATEPRVGSCGDERLAEALQIISSWWPRRSPSQLLPTPRLTKASRDFAPANVTEQDRTRWNLKSKNSFRPMAGTRRAGPKEQNAQAIEPA